MKGECDEINDEHEGSDVIFGLTIFLTSPPNLSRYPSFFGSTHPEVKKHCPSGPAHTWCLSQPSQPLLYDIKN